jgi:hypothetical protein
MNKGAIIGLAIIVVLGIVGYVYYTMKLPFAYTNTSTSSSVPLELTDPLQVPPNTSALDLYYSSYSVKLSDGKTITYTNAGHVDLFGLENITQLLGYVPVNVTITSITLNLTKATITINGVTYPVEIPPSVTFGVNATATRNSTLLLDLLPSVAPLYGVNQTIYVLVPSGVVVQIGQRLPPQSHLPPIAMKEIEEHTANITITGATMSYNPTTGMVTFTVTVKNVGNIPAYLMHVHLKGQFAIKIGNKTLFTPQDVEGEIKAINSTEDEDPFGFNFSMNGNNSNPISSILNQISHMNTSQLNATLTQIFENISKKLEQTGVEVKLPEGWKHNPAMFKNLSLLNATFTKMKSKFDKFIHREEDLLREVNDYKSINFFVASNGTLYLPFSRPIFAGPINLSNVGNSSCAIQMSEHEGEIECEYKGGVVNVPFGYQLSPNNTVTLTFTGELTLGHGLVTLVPMPGNYTVSVQGTREAFARTTFTYS